MIYRFRRDGQCADIEIDDRDRPTIQRALEARGFSLVEEAPTSEVPRLSCDEIAAIFAPRGPEEVLGPGIDGRTVPVGVVAGDIRIRGTVSVPLT